MRSRGAIRQLVALLALVMLLLPGCTSAPDPRPQLLVVVDTDAPVVGQLSSDPALPAALAIDTVRVDLVDDDREVIDFRDFTAPDVLDWPLSFGIVSEEGGKALVRLRIRAFRASRSVRGSLAGATTVEPLASLTIDRLVEIDLPSSSVQTVRLILSAACMGAPPSFQPPLRTCVDEGRREDNPRVGVETDDGGGTRAGRSDLANTVPCASEPPASAACIPGGTGVLGDGEIDGLIDSLPISPPRAVQLSPFHMDTTEFTVGRYRALLRASKVKEEPQPVDPADALRKYCTWMGSSDASHDGFPLNCVSYPAAVAACAAVGGRLPTDAQWEYAARGRGLARRFPWGDAVPRCCTASVARYQFEGLYECSGNGLEPVMSHTDAASCDGAADVSRDGIFDLGGSLSEVMSNEGVSLRDVCWIGPGIVRDPLCTPSVPSAGRFSRGGDWASGTFLSASALERRGAMPSNTVGFRCVYDDAR